MYSNKVTEIEQRQDVPFTGSSVTLIWQCECAMHSTSLTSCSQSVSLQFQNAGQQDDLLPQSSWCAPRQWDKHLYRRESKRARNQLTISPVSEREEETEKWNWLQILTAGKTKLTQPQCVIPNCDPETTVWKKTKTVPGICPPGKGGQEISLLIHFME